METFISDVSGREFSCTEKVSGKSLNPSILQFIQKEHPQFKRSGFLAIGEVNHFRAKYISEQVAKQMGELSDLEKTVLDTFKEGELLSDKMDTGEDRPLSVGQRIADRVAGFGGSWSFIILFGVFILIWMVVNIIVLVNKGFDPYPFILLNLILSCIAAMQAPVIMMSQNRQEEKDRERARKDYMVNLKSELEIRVLHEKIDHLIMHQQQELMEVQKTQIDMMNDILQKMGNK